MDGFITYLLEASINITYLILAVIFFRFILKKISSNMVLFLWFLVALRLIFPFTFESDFSVIPTVEFRNRQELINIVTPEKNIHSAMNKENGMNKSQHELNEIVHNKNVDGIFDHNNEELGKINIGVIWWIWLFGVIFFISYSIFTYIKFKIRLRTTVPLCVGSSKVYQCDCIYSPFLFGFVDPKIYVPFGMGESELNYVILHEEMHIKRKDNWLKCIGFIMLSIYWFHPMVWLAYVLFTRDMEIICDEKVIKNLNKEEKAAYSQTLLSCVKQNHKMGGYPIAFGEVNIRERIKNIMNYKKKPLWMMLLGIILCVILVLSFMGNQKKKTEDRNQNPVEQPEQPEIPQEDVMVDVITAKYNISDHTGADGAIVDFVNEEYLIFHGYFGLFIYSFTEESVIREIDLSPMNCQFTQGDDATEVGVSESGNEIYLHAMSSEDIYVYDVEENTMSKRNYEENKESFYQLLQNNNENIKGKEIYASDNTIGELYYMNGEKKIFLFPSHNGKTRVPSSDDFLKVDLWLYTTENTNWVKEPSYYIINDEVVEIQYYDGISEADGWIWCTKGEYIEVPFKYEIDESQTQDWGVTWNDKYVLIKASPLKSLESGYGAIALWQDEDLTYMIIERAEDKVDLSVVAKLASSTMHYSNDKKR